MRINTQVVLDEITARCPSSSALLRDIREPLADYARRVYTPDARPANPLSADARDRFETAVRQEPGVDQTAALSVIQTGPHYRFALDDDYFSSLAFSVLGCAAAGQRQNVFYNCATITLEEQVRRGPAWLRVDGEPTRAFAVPRRTMAKRSVLLYDEPVKLADELVERVGALSELTGLGIDLDMLAGRQTVREHISMFNQQVFDRFSEANGVSTAVLDDWFFADLLADSLESDSLLARLFADGRILRAVRLLHAQPMSSVRRFVPNSTELFWLNAAGKIRPLHIDDGALRSPRHATTVPFDVESIAAALRARVLVPNLFLVFCLSSILPLIRTVGGAYQAVYHEVFTSAVATVLDENKADEQALQQELRRASLVAWGHNLISRNLVGADVAGARLPAWLPNTSIVDLSDDLSAFTCDELWAKLCG
ncbi:hypothetical protein SAMN04487905_12221 [Actinopolyspora xinjiangensis]|uniref:Uncharacterized protein n=1 Tax=Actinopolyspora xinjiangensis TaxID=405564 RepID=A0A1H0X1R4_9ACTN|nr:hypothetical protein [Actinopolyspora xinjiangensis]SDP96908.1 hypothetical protein SAMN04487905_12221 [Actinopolyspora xinjiangensis]